MRIRERRSDDGLPVPLQVPLLEAGSPRCRQDRAICRTAALSSRKSSSIALGRRRAYWMVSRCIPARWRCSGERSVTSPAGAGCEGMLHLFDRLRPGQVRGVPWLAPVILKLRDLDENDDADLVRKKIEACFAAFVTGGRRRGDVGLCRTDADGGRKVESFEPGMIEYLAPGKDVKFAARPQPAAMPSTCGCSCTRSPPASA